jgi:MFS family permease
LTTSAFQLFYGRIYSNFSIKYTILTAIFIFELGSLICGVAPTSNALIAGRAIAGVGCAGITSGAYIIIGHVFPLRIRPICISSIAMVFAVAAVLGPILGGIFTTHITWRWCFYINLPFGGFTMAALLFFLPPLKHPELNSVPLAEKLKKIDIVGLLIFIPAITCLLIALQWGGSTYDWSNGRIIALFVLFGVLSFSFIAFEYWKGAEATLPMHVITQRSVAAAAWNAFCNGAAFFLLIYYIPFWQQVIRNASAASSGVSLLPFVLGVVIMANLVGFLVMKFGYCKSCSTGNNRSSSMDG